MEFLLSVFEWVAVVVGGILVRAGVAVAVLAAFVAVVLPVMLAFEGGRRLLRRARGLEDVRGFEWRRGRRYAPAHLWLAERGPALRIGLDAVAARVLHGARRVGLPRVGTRVAAGGAFARIGVDALEVTLPAPVDGVVVGVNPDLEASPEVAVHRPYTAGWLVEIQPEGDAHRSLPRAGQALAWFRAEADKVTFALEHAHGYAAADGGVPIDPGHPSLAGEDVRRLAAELLGATVTER